MKTNRVIPLLKGRDAAAAAAGILGLLVTALLAFPVIAAFRAQDSETRATLNTLSGLRAEARLTPALSQQLAELKQRLAGLPGLMQAKSTPLAQAQLQQMLETILTSHGATVRSTQMLPAGTESGFKAVGIQYDLSIPMSRFGELVYAIESHSPYLFIADAGVSGSAQAPAGHEEDPQVEVRWTIKAYRWGTL